MTMPVGFVPSDDVDRRARDNTAGAKLQGWKTQNPNSHGDFPGVGVSVLGRGLWETRSLVGRRLLGLRLLVGDVLHGALVGHLQPLPPERIVDERVRPVWILRLD